MQSLKCNFRKKKQKEKEFYLFIEWRRAIDGHFIEIRYKSNDETQKRKRKKKRPDHCSDSYIFRIVYCSLFFCVDKNLLKFHLYLTNILVRYLLVLLIRLALSVQKTFNIAFAKRRLACFVCFYNPYKFEWWRLANSG